MKFKATIIGVKKSKTYIKYDTIEVTPTMIYLAKDGYVLASMPTPQIDLGRGDTLTITGLKGKLKVREE